MVSTMSIQKLTEALVNFQSTLAPVKKEAENPFFNSKYADLADIIAAIREPLAKNGLAFSQFPDGDGLTTILMHVSGEYIQATASMQPADRKPQTIGSYITYLRRYSLGAVLGIATEADDDGNEATKPKVNLNAGPHIAKGSTSYDPELGF